MIRTVKIQNFKNILDQRIELDHLTVFVGANGSGKTSVLEAIDLVVNAQEKNKFFEIRRFTRSIVLLLHYTIE